MSGQDPHPQGGNLSDMAVDGTSVPADSAKPRTIPSVPRPGQITDPSNDPNNYGSADLAGAADNATDISRVCFLLIPSSRPISSATFSCIYLPNACHLQSTRDNAPSADVITGTGDSLPAEVGSKRLHNVVNSDVSKGHPRYDKHVRQKGSDFDKEATDGPGEDEVVDGVVGGR